MGHGGPRNTYTPDQRREALSLYVEHGPAEAGRRLDIPAGTISQWARRAGKTGARAERAMAGGEAMRRTRAQRRAEVALRSGEAAAEFLERAVGTAKAREGSDWMRAYALAVDKAQLLDGAATGRIELSESEVRAGVQKIRDELKARRERKAAAG